ncbi:MAG: halocarboxylic acid dehydrogenase DehI family protein [Gemmatimonadetes bacterium]|nr:halocarboxylic acid dehydrogenase DehI family protein [Gemmatimonadota bacterium]
MAEHEAEGELARVYHEIRQTLRVSGVNLNFRSWAGVNGFLPPVWDALRPNLETRAFEEAADRLRARAITKAATLGRLGAREGAAPGQSQAYQIRAALRLYHYVNPKLLLLTSAVRLALDGESPGGSGPAREPSVPRGVPAGMYAMEMVEEDTDDPRVAGVFRDIRETLGLSHVNSDYRTLALWPDYLEEGWRRLKPIVQDPEHADAADRLRAQAREEARSLPYPLELTDKALAEHGADGRRGREMTEAFEQLLPGLILNVALLSFDWEEPDALLASPFPAMSPSSNGGAA